MWILSPFKLNNYSVTTYLSEPTKSYYKILTASELNKEKPLLVDNTLNHTELLRQYYRMQFNGKKAYPLAIYPPYLDERMSAQQACFTLFGDKANGLVDNDTKEKFLDCVYINEGSKLEIKKQLRVLGISEFSIYPDLDGLGKSINYDYNNNLNDAQMDNELINMLEPE